MKPGAIVWTEVLLRLALGIVCLVAASEHFFRYCELPTPPEETQELLCCLEASEYIRYSLGTVFLISGILLIAARKWTGLALVLLAPVVFNIAMYHYFLHQDHFRPAILLGVLYIGVCVLNRSRFRSLFGR